MVIAQSLERIADHAVNIAEDVIYVVKGGDVRHIKAEGLHDLNQEHGKPTTGQSKAGKRNNMKGNRKKS